MRKVKRFNSVIYGDNISSHNNDTSKDGFSSSNSPFLEYEIQSRKFSFKECLTHVYSADELVIVDVTPNVPDE